MISCERNRTKMSRIARACGTAVSALCPQRTLISLCRDKPRSTTGVSSERRDMCVYICQKEKKSAGNVSLVALSFSRNVPVHHYPLEHTQPTSLSMSQNASVLSPTRAYSRRDETEMKHEVSLCMRMRKRRRTNVQAVPLVSSFPRTWSWLSA